MKRLIAFLFVIALFPQTALWAQDNSKVDIYGGFSSLTVKSKLPGPQVTAQGWMAGASVPLNGVISVVGDTAVQYKSGSWAIEYLGGFQANKKSEKANVFVRALYGYATGGGNNVPKETAFMMGYGAGLDVRVAERMSFRVIQFDWLPSNDNGIWQTKQVRFGFGAVYHVKSE